MKNRIYDYADERVSARLWRRLVIRPMLRWQAWRCARAKAYLLTHDYTYRINQVGLEVVRKRNLLYGQGVAPNDPSVPDQFTVEQTLPPMAWPHLRNLMQ